MKGKESELKDQVKILEEENRELKNNIRNLSEATRGLFPFMNILVAEFETDRFADKLNAALDKVESALDAIPKGVFTKRTKVEMEMCLIPPKS
jgi:hypothetical protein